MSKPNTMAVDQYGHYYGALGTHPRKELLRILNRKHAAKMFIDNDKGESRHVGYIIAGLWLSVFNVTEWSGTNR